MSTATATWRESGVLAYIVVTLAYWAFMLTDGALRMLVLLHFHTLGFTPVQIAYLFLLYEFMGIVTNLSAGWIAARFGLTPTLYAGMGVQIVGLVALTRLDPAWSLWVSVAFVMGMQGLAGVAKDLTKMSAKSAVKVLVPKDAQGQLFTWVARLTGSKNAVKGIGFLLGAGLLALAGFDAALLGMAGVLAVILAAVALAMPSGLPKGKKGVPFAAIVSKDARVNLLSAARVFLFGARDVWFVVGIPIYFYDVLSRTAVMTTREAFLAVGCFMAVWVVGYGVIQTLAPRVLRAEGKSLAETAAQARTWVASLTVIPAALALAAALSSGPAHWLTALLIGGLLVFGVVFAVNSSLHSYLILAFSERERVTMDVGFYYMSNAAGRFIGTLLSGLSYQMLGLAGCLGVAAIMAALSWLWAGALARRAARTQAAGTGT
jgi:hypothetical protein